MQTAYVPVPTTAKPASAPAWSAADILALYELPFMDLVFRAQQTHRAHFDPNAIQLSSLLSIKTGGCPEDCAYCPQSSHYDTGHRLQVVRLGAAPGGAHAEALRAAFLGLAGRGHHVRQGHQLVGVQAGVVVRGLRAIGAILGAAAGLDRQQAG